MLNDDSKLTQQCCLVFDGLYELLKEEKATIASKKSDGKKRIQLGTGGTKSAPHSADASGRK